MSGCRGFLFKTETLMIDAARRELRGTPAGQGPAYAEAMRRFVSEVYKCIGVESSKLYCFSSPLACMLAIPHLIHLYSSDLLHVMTDFQNVFSPSLKTTSEADKERAVATILREALRVSKKDQLSDIFREAFIRQMEENCGKDGTLTYTRLLETFTLAGGEWWSIISSGIWVWPYNKFAVACEMPVRTEFDERGRSHCENDAAVEFADGYRVWAWHGLVVPKRIILFPESLTAADVEKEVNVEIRRIMIERIGPGKYLKESGAVVEDMDTLTLKGSAPRALMKDKLGNKWLVGTDGSTARVYTMSVPEDVRTCKEAHERISGFEESRLIAEA